MTSAAATTTTVTAKHVYVGSFVQWVGILEAETGDRTLPT